MLAGEFDADGAYRPSFLVELEPAHSDARGSIQMLVNVPTHNVSLITSAAKTVRSNHYHKRDWHYMYVISGAFDYYYRAHRTGEAAKCLKVSAGDMVWTPPMEEHATVFTADTMLLALSLLPRDQDSYEADVVRIPMVDPETLELVATVADGA